MKDPLVAVAEAKIAEVLRDLENLTHMLVLDVHLHTTDVTCMEDARPQHRQTVEIKVQRMPGHCWSQAKEVDSG